MKKSQLEPDWIKVTKLITNKLKNQFDFIPIDEIEASSFVGVAVANSTFDPSKGKNIEYWLYRVGCKRTIDDLRHRRLIDRPNSLRKNKERIESDIVSGNDDWSIFELNIVSKDKAGELERKDFWKEVIKFLSKIEKKIILLHYRYNKQMKEVAVLLKFTEGRVSQIIKEALLKIKKRFEDEEFVWNEFFS